MSETRRRASARIRPVGPRAPLAVAGGLAVLALVVQVVGGSGAGSIAPIVDEVRSAELACPAPVVTGSSARSAVTLYAPESAADIAAAQAADAASPSPAPRSGAATLSDLGRTGSPRARISSPGRTSVDVSKLSTPLLARGTGVLAPGLAAELVTTGRSGAARGLEAVACTTAQPTSWFVGAATAAGRRDRLVLTNPEAVPAVVDLRFWNEGGPVEAPPNSTGIDVPALGAVSIPLEGMTAGHARLGIEVRASSGRISAVVHDSDERGVQPRGVDWIAPAPSPSRSVVIPGLPDGKLGRSLHLLVPGENDAIVTVRALTPDNSFVPAGLDNVEVKAGRVAEFNLAQVGETAASALVVTSDRPVVAVVRQTRSAKGGAADIAFGTAAPALTSPAAVPAGSGPSGTSTRLILAAPRGDAEVVLTVRPASGDATTRTIRIPAGRTVLVDPTPKGKAGGYSILLAPAAGSGPVHAARVLRGSGADVTVTAVHPGRYTVSIPGIEPDLTALLP
ncbi:DUF5719 family protein [Sporichthya polymorpha]|uniref:DUF5719 family protein n=1 Tax=Sporichthya polymorpha TaxID=35751 RepID=UPI000372EA88|nr:DUF5719 family protein [Sporichthya polymorpha]